MIASLVHFLIAGPIVGGLMAYVCPGKKSRQVVVIVTGLLIALAAIVLFLTSREICKVEHLPGMLPGIFETLLGVVVILIGRNLQKTSVMAFGVAQVLIAWAGLFSKECESGPTLIVDGLSLILLLIISLIGPLILVYALGYMDRHDEHPSPQRASSGRFFFFLVAFLGAMNGLVMANDLRWLSVFWEATTLCSFFLIGHEGTPEARVSAERALLVNVFGGTVLMFGGFFAEHFMHLGSLNLLIEKKAVFPIALLVLAALTKSAQLPFQNWLLGAMVAPTPVSALLHSSTMVKAGVYLVVRLAPGFYDTRIQSVIALAGAFTFVVCSALAVGQSNGKKVLAYSTIANLGLIIACAGINSPIAYGAAITLIIFHAISKALLFIGMGTIEQFIGSRDIEDMQGLPHRMPYTTVAMVIGMISMMAPPFGMLIGKWIAMEAAMRSPLVMIFFVAGSALTVVFWAKWIGRIVTTSYHEKYPREILPQKMLIPIGALAAATVLSGFVAIPAFSRYIIPLAISSMRPHPEMLAAIQAYENLGNFLELLLVGLVVSVVIAHIMSRRVINRTMIRPPFLCGENVKGGHTPHDFRSVGDKPETAMARGYYYRNIFGEEKITVWADPVALAIVLSILGMVGL